MLKNDFGLIFLLLKLFWELILNSNAFGFLIIAIFKSLIIYYLLSVSVWFVNEVLVFLWLAFPDILIKLIKLIFAHCLWSCMACRILSAVLNRICDLYWIYTGMEVSLRHLDFYILLYLNLVAFNFIWASLILFNIDAYIIYIIW